MRYNFFHEMQGKRPNQVAIVFYEDMSVDPQAVAQMINDLLALKLSSTSLASAVERTVQGGEVHTKRRSPPTCGFMQELNASSLVVLSTEVKTFLPKPLIAKWQCGQTL